MASAKGEKFITLFIAKYSIQKRTLTYINAAHNPPVMITKNKVSTLKTGCTGLGMFDDIDIIKEGSVELNNETKIVCYTDGLTELENDAGDEFGLDALKELIKNNPNGNMMDLNTIIMETIMSYKQSKPYIDDIALFSIKIS
jgi:sigma-B regulation protein RsbU (phosphoserine phosphatase)